MLYYTIGRQKFLKIMTNSSCTLGSPEKPVATPGLRRLNLQSLQDAFQPLPKQVPRETVRVNRQHEDP